MFKFLTAVILSLLFSQFVQAQKDTVTILMNKYDFPVKDKAHADYLLFIMPLDTNSRMPQYPVAEYYLNGKPKLKGFIDTLPLNPLTFEGSCLRYFPNGKRKSIINYLHGNKSGSIILYYPNGKLYAIENYTADRKCKLIECRDSLGNVLATNGEGKWIKYDDNIHFELEEGSVKDSLEEGEWREAYPGYEKFLSVYHKGIIVSSTDPQRSIGETVFTAVEKMPVFPGGQLMLNYFIAKSIKYPAEAKANNIQGTVYINCIVEKDGSLSNFKIGNNSKISVDKSLQDEALRVVKSMPTWIPAEQNNKRVRVYETIPIVFSTLPLNSILQTISDTTVYTAVQMQPQFNGSYIDFFEKNIKYAKEDIDNHIQGKVIVQFVVEKDGKLSNIRILKGLSTAFNTEVLRVLSLTPQWIPATVGGEPVRAYFTMPVYFNPN